MTPQEQQMIDGLIQRVQNAPIAEKDFDAEQRLQQGLGRNPNALYILAQTVLVQSYALEQSQKQLADAKDALARAQQQAQQQPKHATSFLGSLFGSSEPERQAAPSPPPQQSQYAPVPTYSQPQPYGQAQQYPPAYAQPYPVQPAPAAGGFLRGAMQTAAGVAAGALAFEGVESLMHGFGGHGGGFGGGSGFGSFGDGAPREEIVNNYYGDSAGHEHEQGGHGFLGNDVEDRTQDGSLRDDAASSNFADTSSDDDNSYADDAGVSDDSGSFDSGSDDSSSNDDTSFS